MGPALPGPAPAAARGPSLPLGTAGSPALNRRPICPPQQPSDKRISPGVVSTLGLSSRKKQRLVKAAPNSDQNEV